MSEFRREIAIGVTIAVIAISGLAVLSMTVLSGSTNSPTQSGPLYQVIFAQDPECGAQQVYVSPWGVTLENTPQGNMTIIVPPGSTAQAGMTPGQTYVGNAGALNASYRSITFTVPPGVYSYEALGFMMIVNSPGTVTVNDTNVLVQVGAEISCAN